MQQLRTQLGNENTAGGKVWLLFTCNAYAVDAYSYLLHKHEKAS